jgi:hypothetical protein
MFFRIGSADASWPDRVAATISGRYTKKGAPYPKGSTRARGSRDQSRLTMAPCSNL